MTHRVAAILLALAPAPAIAAPDAAALREVDRIFGEWRLAAHVPGLVYGVVVDGRLVHVRGLGVQDLESNRPVTADSLFRIASMSKAFTALAILKLRDDGKLALDAPAETYLPEIAAWTYPTTDSPRITVRNLLTHSSGFVEDNPWGDRQQVMAEADFTALLKGGVAFAQGPGLGFEYSNLGYAMLGRIIGNVSGVRYQDYIRREMMTPLGMTSTGYDVFASSAARRAIGYSWRDNRWVREADMKDGAFGAMGGIETSASDYAKWVVALLAAWPARDGAETGPVRRATIREIVTGSNFVRGQNRPAAAGPPCRQAATYGMAWSVIDDCDLGRVVTHTGGYPGYGSVVMLLPDKGVGIFALGSRTYGAGVLPTYRAALALNAAKAIPDRMVPVSAGLAASYAAARAVWRASAVEAAPLADNMLMDRDAAAWKTAIDKLKAEVGKCAADEKVTPVSAMEGKFTWSCTHGRVTGRVQRAPTPALAIQALEFNAATP
ncbi:serine hydrolase domain-containing protein [Sandarakinorhabdus sp. DWP1-3-1]|uniref:serine hydrolase domain-containing protein n=1 Tax=Sandarakinorhabdus sp. DWP1-3-1 TaxID=2804627 RepID=UPI003CEB3044